ncbi:serine/threonine-protein kinase [Tengunoibacter tsumagoiensis]|uniref:non-specific serine/threonine protein kinase n=1 Tax=Tengunoibacter tsumagoiensis TaxID=2014871 RepID=A0A401ZZB8_9CHLR|nr:serine/threonine-protein kinase [Tengunoibacter tsumagoiensis]GCE12195.1 hypothetical protein KTT_20540 [Tengunoibacter tsumagoiensis]
MSRVGPLSNQRLANKYMLEELLGMGAFGSVYRAQNERLQRTQAIKVVSAQMMGDPKWHERFNREAQLLASLAHPNIVPVHDFDIDNEKNLLFLVMPYIEGGTLEEIIKERAPLPLEEIEGYLAQICAALDYAHTSGLVHLDLKPANLLFQRHSSTLLLSDFGLAHLMKEGSIEGGTSLHFGTLQYMAPEQFRGQPQRSSDIYALGILLFRMLTGQLPYSGTSLILDHLQAPIPSAVALRPDLPAEMDLLISKALAKEPTERFSTAGLLLKVFRLALSPPLSGRLGGAPKGFQIDITSTTKALPVVEALQREDRELHVQRQTQSQSFRPPLQEIALLVPEITALERREIFHKKVYGYSSSLFWILPCFFLFSLGLVYDTYRFSFLFTSVALLLAALCSYILAYRKSLSLLNVFASLFVSLVLIYPFSEIGWHLLPTTRTHPLTSTIILMGTRDLFTSRQVVFGLLVGGIWSCINYWWYFSSNTRRITLIADVGIILLVSGVMALPTWLMVAYLATMLNWGFGFGASWYWSLVYLVVALLGGTGFADLLHLLFRSNSIEHGER